MTPECPKGPERGARPTCSCGTCQREAAARNAPIPYLRRHVAEAIFDALKAYNSSDVDVAADSIVAMVQPELERLTSQVEQQRVTLRDWYDYSRRTLLAKRDWRRRVSEAEAEVSRLREQLAAQPKPVATEWAVRFGDGTGHVRPQSGEQPARDFVDRWGDGVAVVSRPVYDWKFAPSRDSATSEASPIVHTVLLSSDTGVMGEWQAFCSGCEQGSKGDLAHAEFWKDQHLADVLVPQPDFGCLRIDLVSQWKKGDKALYKARPEDEGEECEVVAVAGDTAIVEADPFPFGNPQRWSVDVSELHPLPPREPSCEEIVPEGPEDASLCGQDVVPGSDRCADHEGRPSGSTAAPRSGFKSGDLVRWNGDTGWLEGEILRPTSNETKRSGGWTMMVENMWDVAVTNLGTFYANNKRMLGWVVYLTEERLERISRPEDAAQAAGSEATPKLVRYLTSICHRWRCGHTYNWHASTNRCEACPCEGFVDAPAPSPSLRKKGEDSGNR